MGLKVICHLGAECLRVSGAVHSLPSSGSRLSMPSPCTTHQCNHFSLPHPTILSFRPDPPAPRYVWLSANSTFKSESDLLKYEKVSHSRPHTTAACSVRSPQGLSCPHPPQSTCSSCQPSASGPQSSQCLNMPGAVRAPRAARLSLFTEALDSLLPLLWQPHPAATPPMQPCCQLPAACIPLLLAKAAFPLPLPPPTARRAS